MLVNQQSIRPYIYPVSTRDVFATFGFSIEGVSTQHARLVFRDLGRGNFLAAVGNFEPGEIITVVKFQTNQPLVLAENFTRDVSWTDPQGRSRVGLVSSAGVQNASSREYVIQPEHILSITTAAYRSMDGITYNHVLFPDGGPSYIPFFVSLLTENRISYITDSRIILATAAELLRNIPLLPNGQPNLAGLTNVQIRAIRSNQREFELNPDNFHRAVRLHPTYGTELRYNSARVGQ